MANVTVARFYDHISELWLNGLFLLADGRANFLLTVSANGVKWLLCLLVDHFYLGSFGVLGYFSVLPRHVVDSLKPHTTKKGKKHGNKKKSQSAR